MTLLDDAFEASGGLARWRQLKGFTVHASLAGAVFAGVDKAAILKDVVVEGDTRAQSMRLTGFTNPNHFGLLSPDRVAVESLDGNILKSWSNPHTTFVIDPKSGAAWDDLQLVYICAFSIWNFVMTPFMLTQPGVSIEDLPPRKVGNHIWRCLRALFPDDVMTSSQEQILYFDTDGLQRRADYQVFGTPVAHYASAHQKYSGVVIPTLRRSMLIEPDGTPVATPYLLDIEIFDATFE